MEIDLTYDNCYKFETRILELSKSWKEKKCVCGCVQYLDSLALCVCVCVCVCVQYLDSLGHATTCMVLPKAKHNCYCLGPYVALPQPSTIHAMHITQNGLQVYNLPGQAM